MPGNVDAGGPVRANDPVAPAGAVQADAGTQTDAVQADAGTQTDADQANDQADQANDQADQANDQADQANDQADQANDQAGNKPMKKRRRDQADQANDQADQAGNKPMKKRRRVGINELRSLGLPVNGTSLDQSRTSTGNNREKRMAAVVTMSMRPSVYKDESSPSSSEASSSSEKPSSLKFPSSTDDSSPSLPSDDSSSPPSSDEDGLRAARLVVMRITGDLPYDEFEAARAALRMVCEADGHSDYSAMSSGNTSDDVVSPWTGSDGDMSRLTGSGESLDDYMGILPVSTDDVFPPTGTDEGGDSPQVPQYDGDWESAWPSTDDSAEDADPFMT